MDSNVTSRNILVPKDFQNILILGEKKMIHGRFRLCGEEGIDSLKTDPTAFANPKRAKASAIIN